jgi:hypothetical protein
MRTIFEFKGATLTIEGQELNAIQGSRYLLEVASLSTFVSINFPVSTELYTWYFVLSLRGQGLKEEWIRFTPKTMVIR